MLEEHLKRTFTILQRQCTDSRLAKMGGDKKYEAIEGEQDVIVMLKIIKGVMFRFDGNRELTRKMWEAYVSLF